MAKDIISDFLIKFSFDSKEVMKGLDKLDKALNKKRALSKTIAKEDSSIERNKEKAARREEARHKRAIKLMRQRQKAQKSLAFRRSFTAERIERSSIAGGLRKGMGARGFQQQFGGQLDLIKNAKSAKELRLHTARLRDNLRDATLKQRMLNKELQKGNFLSQKMAASSKQLIGNYVGAFAVAGAGAGVIGTGVAFQSMEAGMLAVSDGAEHAAERVKWLRDMTMEMGVDATQTANSFKLLAASANNAVTEKDLRGIFRSVNKYAVTLKAPQEQTQGALKALGQMFSKGSITAEEMRQQLGDRLAGAFPIMAAAAKDAGVSVSGTTAELSKLMEQGLLDPVVVLPFFAKRLEETTNANDAYRKSLESTAVAQGRFMNTLRFISADVFESGLGKMFTEMLVGVADDLERLTPLFKSFGRIFGSTMKIIQYGIQLITPPLQVLGFLLESLTFQLGTFSFIVGSVLTTALGAAAVKFGLFSTAAIAALTPILIKVSALLLLLAGVEEIVNAFTQEKEGVIWSPVEGYFGTGIGADPAAQKTEAGKKILAKKNDSLPDTITSALLSPLTFLGRGMRRNLWPELRATEAQRSANAAGSSMSRGYRPHKQPSASEKPNVTIHVDGSKDPEVVAKVVKLELERSYSNFV